MKKRVLIIEDNPMNLELARDVLEASGCEVLSATNGTEGLALAMAVRPDLILMDIQLPGRDGISLTMDLKADPATREIPVIALTAYAMRGDCERIMQAGCAGYIPKPINTRNFARTVTRWLNGTQQSAACEADSDANR